MNGLPGVIGKEFRHAGLFVMRSPRLYLLAVCHPIGVKGYGPHKHNDWLSFELCVGDQPVIIDPGTYCYTGNMTERRRFRATAYHNTVVVDGQEQLDIWNSMFGLVNPFGEIRVRRWESAAHQDLLEAEHTGYARLSPPVIHRRRFILDKVKHQVEIEDEFLGDGEHLLEWYLHLNPGLNCQVMGTEAIVSRDLTPILAVTFPGAAGSMEVKTGWVSPAYNRREAAPILYYRRQINLTRQATFSHRLDMPEILS
jgi:hypothetical protein